MIGRADPPALRWLIGAELLNYRNRAGASQAEAAREVLMSAGMIAHIERGRYFPAPKQIARLLEFYGAPNYDIERLTTLVGRADQRSWLARWDDVIPDWLRTFIGLEGLAAEEVIYAPMVIPALLQIESYARGATSSSDRVRPDQTDRMVRLRMERQDRLLANELRLTAIIEESVLDRPIGGRDVLRAQLEHLILLSEWDNVDLLVLPTSIGRHDGLESRFLLLHFAEAQSIAYVEYTEGAVYIQDQDEVSMFSRISESLRLIALSPADSLAAIKTRLAA